MYEKYFNISTQAAFFKNLI